MNIDPMTLSQVFIDTYYDFSGKRAFIRAVKERFPELDETVIEAIWHTINFMDKRFTG